MSRKPLHIAVIGAGIAGLSASWLLSQRHNVEIFERSDRLGGHAHTVDINVGGARAGVDAAFIVYNEPNYPNLMALFRHLGVETELSDMSFSVSLDDGRLEYASDVPRGLFAQKTNMISPRFLAMLLDVRRFYRSARDDLRDGRLAGMSIGAYLDRQGYGTAFERDHLLPMGAAIWSSNRSKMRAFPADAFVRFFESHGLLELRGRPAWRTVTGGSRQYVDRLRTAFNGRVRRHNQIRTLTRTGNGIEALDQHGVLRRYDHVVIASHADQALGMLGDATPAEAALLGAISYTRNRAIMHTDPAQMPSRRSAWASWNYLGHRDEGGGPPHLSYWMNRLQNLDTPEDVFVTLNPSRPVASEHILRTFEYDHPFFDARALEAQRRLWSLQGHRNTWFCGSYFGFGFHEDALQSGLAVAEELGGLNRPWTVREPSGRIHRTAEPPESVYVPDQLMAAE
ncbi:MAG: NAD/FAD-binding protein [Alphaproteobacteria bacterium]|nr:NAD/FAD-binding protein [Alphaproteobacteria bacterium]